MRLMNASPAKKNGLKWKEKRERLEQNPVAYAIMRRIEDGERRERARFTRLAHTDPVENAKRFSQLKFPERKDKLA